MIPLSRRPRARFACTLLAALGLGGELLLAAPVHAASSPEPGAGQGSTTQTSISVDAAGDQGTVNRAVSGHAYLWPFAGMGSYDEQAGSYYPRFVSQLRDGMRPGSLRYPGGITGETFYWKRAIGPQAQRQPMPFGPSSGPSNPAVGPDEFGELLDATGALGVMTVSFGLGSAQNATELAEYLTQPAGSGPWADLRAKNGHPKPYDIPYWEVGNEENIAPYWRAGTPVTVGGPSGACQNVRTCLYVYGGSTGFTNQAVVGYADRRSTASYSTGAAGQSFYVAFPPVAPSSATVYVGGQAWTQVSSLAAASPDAHAYVFDAGTGRITFGDGVHGAVPASGARVTATYVSGPHDGFLDFYHALKAVDPGFQVCSSDPSTDFIESMGSQLPYDCLEHHPYAGGGNVPNDLPIGQYETQLMAVPAQQAASASQLQSLITQYAGRRVPLALTEYGQFISANPNGYPYFHYSLDEALFNASQLAEWIRLGVPVANRQLLTGEIPPPSACCAGLPGAAPYATTAAIGAPGPNTVLEATGEAYGLFAGALGGTLLPAHTSGNPQLAGANGESSGALSVVAVRRRGSVDLLVINRSPTDSVTSRVDPVGFRHRGVATTATLNGSSALSYNTPEQPNAVAVSHGQIPVGDGAFPYTFPAHSITTLQMSGQVVRRRPELTLTSSPSIAAPGSPITATVTLSNPTAVPITGRLAVTVPSGWTVRGANPAPYLLQPGEKTTLTYPVSAPGDAPPGTYEISASAYGYGITLASGYASAVVPTTLPAAFNNVGITDDSAVDPGNLDGVGNSYSEQALTSVGLGPGSRVQHAGLTFTWPDVPAGTPDNAVANGQVIAVSGTGHTLGFIGSVDHGPATGSGTVYYADGSTGMFQLSLGRYFSPPQPGEDVVAEMDYLNSAGVGGRPHGRRDHPAWVYYAGVPLQPGKAVLAVRLPVVAGVTGTAPKLHIFAIAVG